MSSLYNNDLLSLQFEKLPENYRPYAYDILKSLYYDDERGKNLNEIYSIFSNKNIKLIRKIVKVISEDINLIQENHPNSSPKEKRYFITNSGKMVVQNFYNFK